MFRRRPRGADEPSLCGDPRPERRGRAARAGGVGDATARASSGAGASCARPWRSKGRPLSGSTGTVLDPVASLRYRVRLAAGRVRAAVLRDGMTESVEAARDAGPEVPRPRRGGTRARPRLHPRPGLPAPPGHRQRRGPALRAAGLARALRGRLAARRCRACATRNTLGQSGLWPHGISGDVPILLLRVVEENDLPLVRQVLQAQQYWRLKGLSADVVILNEHPVSYLDEMHEALVSLIASGPWSALEHKPGGVHLLRGGQPHGVRSRPAAVVAAAVLCRRARRADEPARPSLSGAAAGRRPAGGSSGGGEAAGAAGDMAVEVPSLDACRERPRRLRARADAST